ncbi:hypothetical protein GCM10010174_74860 [Kutzneria viridogrisea]|uniref:Transcription regulator PadR C-terminal domain-containing protein n=2 Tax=Kutzneria TaxID=43356 RepID=W5W6X2_9PSEU|nr:hypothetical protein [Kutzneria albida]AHH96510.1 hypothetical protein KALB_3143 [Kutzneria albida DSM 43870]MBA8928272.1 hypothetical protein [Kutzneria viridogrisea]
MDSWEREVQRRLAFCQALLAKEADNLGRALTVRFAIRRAEGDLEWLAGARAELAVE